MWLIYRFKSADQSQMQLVLEFSVVRTHTHKLQSGGRISEEPHFGFFSKACRT